jgi:putative Mg2+ transporter-C (MgtC) family protein
MAALQSFTISDLLDSLVSLCGAFVLGTIIGAERQYRQRSGGLRTNVLVAVGAAAFVDIGMHLGGNAGATQIIAYVVSGVGFLGAGVIMKEGRNVWGLNTAATLWGSAAVGACAGADLAVEAIAVTAFVLAGNTLLRPLVNAINRAPISAETTEAQYEIRVTTDAARIENVRDLLEAQLRAANYPVRGVEIEDRGAGTVELVAALLSTDADASELDALVARLKQAADVQHVSWTARAAD